MGLRLTASTKQKVVIETPLGKVFLTLQWNPHTKDPRNIGREFEYLIEGPREIKIWREDIEGEEK